MSEAITIEVPHKLGQAEAQSRIENGFGKAEDQMGGMGVSIEHTWAENVMSFVATAMGQNVNGRLTVMETAVRIELDLPWMLAKLAAPFLDKLKAKTQVLLEDKRA